MTLQEGATGAAIVIALLVVGGVAGDQLRDDDVAYEGGFPVAERAPPDTPPAEFAYLDSGRVLAYLGQVEGGLSATQARTLSDKTSTTASLTAKDIASAERSSERLRGSSETVTLTEADRFYTLLRILRAKQGGPDDTAFEPLKTIDATLSKRNTGDTVLEGLKGLEEGDFVRIRNAHLFIPTYAAVLPRARFASYYLGGNLEPPTRALYAPVSRKARDAVSVYRARLKKNPRIPVVVPTLRADRREDRSDVVTFFMPARYRSLSREASLLGGEMTVVGKVVYKDPRLPDEVAKDDPRLPEYLDRETLTTFAPALNRADRLLLRRLKMKRDTVVEQVRGSLTIRSPVAVIIPVAIYQ